MDVRKKYKKKICQTIYHSPKKIWKKSLVFFFLVHKGAKPLIINYNESIRYVKVHRRYTKRKNKRMGNTSINTTNNKLKGIKPNQWILLGIHHI
jgi:hypothetical protein